jgi:hypothetical protein
LQRRFAFVRSKYFDRIIATAADAKRCWSNFAASSAIGGNRVKMVSSSSGTPYSQPLEGNVMAGVSYSAALNISFSPDPNGLALDDCSPLQKTFNQYLITDGVPCVITYSGSDTTFLERVRQEAEWTLSNPPLPLWPRLENRSNGYGEVRPVHYVTYDINFGEVDDGLKFDLRNGLPADNSGFGVRTLTHSLAGLGVRVNAQVALFFPATGTEHPDGYPRGFTNSNMTTQIPTPNWIYYYNQLVPSPEVVCYTPTPADRNLYGFYIEGQPRIWLCNAHGSSKTAIFRIATETMIEHPWLKYFGTEEVRGVDTYARVLKHELAHKRCWEYIHRPGADPLQEDTDQDSVPDAWERRVGLKVGERDTAGFISIWGGGYEPSEGDREVFARLYEEGVTGPRGSDWADSGLQKVGPAPNVCQPTVVRN